MQVFIQGLDFDAHLVQVFLKLGCSVSQHLFALVRTFRVHTKRQLEACILGLLRDFFGPVLQSFRRAKLRGDGCCAYLCPINTLELQLVLKRFLEEIELRCAYFSLHLLHGKSSLAPRGAKVLAWRLLMSLARLHVHFIHVDLQPASHQVSFTDRVRSLSAYMLN